MNLIVSQIHQNAHVMANLVKIAMNLDVNLILTLSNQIAVKIQKNVLA